jgi:hypothetical protein
MSDLTEQDWVGFATLFELQKWEQYGVLRLRFKPDSRWPEADALLLLLYGYKSIYGQDEIRANILEEGLARSGFRYAERIPFVGTIIGYSRLNVDDVTREMDERWISKKLALSAGGFYKLFPLGYNKAERMFRDLVARA